MKPLLTTAFLGAALLSTPVWAEAVKYDLDASHAQVVFGYNHFGYSTTWGMFSGFEGEIMFDEADPAASSVTVSMATNSMFTGWEKRFGHFMSPDFFGDNAESMITFTSTAIEVSGEDTALITGDLTLNGMTKPVTLDAKLNAKGDHPMQGKAWLGFDATTTVKRSDFGLGKFAPAVSDDVSIMISIEAGKS